MQNESSVAPSCPPLAERLVAADPVEASRVRETLVSGFYGTKRQMPKIPSCETWILRKPGYLNHLLYWQRKSTESSPSYSFC